MFFFWFVLRMQIYHECLSIVLVTRPAVYILILVIFCCNLTGSIAQVTIANNYDYADGRLAVKC